MKNYALSFPNEEDNELIANLDESFTANTSNQYFPLNHFFEVKTLFSQIPQSFHVGFQSNVALLSNSGYYNRTDVPILDVKPMKEYFERRSLVVLTNVSVV